MTAQEFVKDFVKIDFIKEDKIYGHYPHQIIAKMPGDNLEVNVLMVDSVAAIYQRIREYNQKDFKSLFISIDFPATGDIDFDFVGVFIVKNNKVAVFALPYDNQTGQKFKPIYKSLALGILLGEFMKHTKI